MEEGKWQEQRVGDDIRINGNRDGRETGCRGGREWQGSRGRVAVQERGGGVIGPGRGCDSHGG